MAQKKTPHIGDGGAFGNTVHGQANDSTVSLFSTDYQINFICRRTRLRPEIARVVAGLCFGSAA